MTPASRLGMLLTVSALTAAAAFAQENFDADEVGEPAAKALSAGGFKCGVERWAVKTLSDGDADKVALDSPQTSDIGSLISDPASSPWQGFSSAGSHQMPPDVRQMTGAVDETKVFTMTVYVLRYKYENDRDIHMVIADPTNQGTTMIAESVDPQCDGAQSRADLFTQVRSQFTSLFPTAGQAGQFIDVTPPALVKITGVRFFDHLHNQSGVAPNGVELHPVIDIQSAAAAQSKSDGAAPSPSEPAQPPANPAPSDGASQ